MHAHPRPFVFCVVAAFAAGLMASSGAGQVLDLAGQSLTNYLPTGTTAKQDLRPRFDQRGVDLDGTLRAPAVLGWSINADPLGGGYASGRMIGDINLFTGTYAPTDVDLALPTIGLPVVIGRVYNAVADNSGRIDTNGFQGYNWSQLAQPELIFKAGGIVQNDTIYLVYGADRYIEFQNCEPESGIYKAKNGAAGIIVFAAEDGAEPATYTLSDSP